MNYMHKRNTRSQDLQEEKHKKYKKTRMCIQELNSELPRRDQFKRQVDFWITQSLHYHNLVHTVWYTKASLLFVNEVLSCDNLLNNCLHYVLFSNNHTVFLFSGVIRTMREKQRKEKKTEDGAKIRREKENAKSFTLDP